MKKNLILIITTFTIFGCNSSIQNQNTNSLISSYSSSTKIKPADIKHVQFVGSKISKDYFTKNKIFYEVAAPPRIYSLDYNGFEISNSKKIADGQAPIILEDENKMIFTYLDWNDPSNQVPESIRIMDFSTSKVEEVYKCPVNAKISYPTLSKDKKKLLFCEPTLPDTYYYKILDLDTKKVTTVLSSNSFVNYTFTPDSKSVIIGTSGEIQSFDLSGSNKKTLYKENGYEFKDLTFSQDGSTFAFTKSYTECSDLPGNTSFISLSKVYTTPFNKNISSFSKLSEFNYDVNLLFEACKPKNITRFVNEKSPFFLNKNELIFNSNVSVKTPFMGDYNLTYANNIVKSDLKSKNGNFITIKNVVDEDGYILDDSPSKIILFVDYDRNRIIYYTDDMYSSNHGIYSINFDGSDIKTLQSN